MAGLPDRSTPRRAFGLRAAGRPAPLLGRKRADNRRLRAALLERARSPVAGDADDDYFASLRKSAETGI